MSSIWSLPAQSTRPKLSDDLSTEAVVIGAGLAGLLIADRLQQAGLRTIVLEAGRIGSGQLSGTTAKVTAQHGLKYHRLVQQHGTKKAHLYAKANQQAVDAYRTLIHTRHIDCDWQDRDAYVFARDAVAALQQEAATASDLGLPASYILHPPLPFATAGAVKFSGQGQFHPLRFAAAIAKPLEIYEQSRVISASGQTVYTETGSVHARHIIFTCHVPFVRMPGFYYARMHQQRSYVLALENAPFDENMFISADTPTLSFRSYKNLLLLGGGGHRTGKEGGGYKFLQQAAQRLFPDSHEVARWSAQDSMPADGIPYIGRFSTVKPNWYFAGGFQKWGMTTSMVAAEVISAMILCAHCPYIDLFTPQRLSFSDISTVTKEGIGTLHGWKKQYLTPPSRDINDVSQGQGAIAQKDGHKCACSKTENGTLHTLSSRCTHLGCQLHWNANDDSWDCPCHGSRFDREGQVLDGPATQNLPKK